nr:sulfotransferase [Natronocella acetinitrilica]
MSPTRPNLFIVGAPKCGTTAMAEYLGAHPDIFMSRPKEPLYFLHENDKQRKIIHEDHYLSIFTSARGCAVVGEASVWYLYSRHARERIKAFSPGARIIIMTRHPYGFVPSLHAQMVFSGREEENLSEAWRRERERLGIAELPTIEYAENWRRMYPVLMQHDHFIAEYKNTFGAENVLVLRQEDMVKDVATTYRRALAFLGVPDDGREQFEVINASKGHRNEFVRRLLHWTSRQQWLIDSLRAVKRRLGIGSFGAYALVARLNLRRQTRPALPTAVRRDIDRLSQT